MMKHRSQYVTLWSAPSERSVTTNGRPIRRRIHDPTHRKQPNRRMSGSANRPNLYQANQGDMLKPQSPTPPRPSLVECERNRIARELHDHAGQIITTCILRLDMLIKQQASGYQGAADELCSLRTLLDTYTHEVRQIAYDLRSQVLDSFKTVESYALEVGQNAGIAMNIAIAPNVPQLPEEIEVAVFRAFQEAITNVVRHANAHDVSLQVSCDSETVTLILEDDGRGFYPQRMESYPLGRPHLGLIGMRERIEEVGGQLKIESTPERGTRVTITVPSSLQRQKKRLRRVS